MNLARSKREKSFPSSFADGRPSASTNISRRRDGCITSSTARSSPSTIRAPTKTSSSTSRRSCAVVFVVTSLRLTNICRQSDLLPSPRGELHSRWAWSTRSWSLASSSTSPRPDQRRRHVTVSTGWSWWSRLKLSPMQMTSYCVRTWNRDVTEPINQPKWKKSEHTARRICHPRARSWWKMWEDFSLAPNARRSDHQSKSEEAFMVGTSDVTTRSED